MYMGTYVVCSSWGEHGGIDGVSVFAYEPETGKLSDRQIIEKALTPDAISGSSHFHDNAHKLIYMVDEIDKAYDKCASGKKTGGNSGLKQGGGGTIVVWKYGSKGSLERIQEVDSYGSNPSMFTKRPDGKYGVVSCHGQAACATQTRASENGFELVPAYSEPNIVLFKMKADGTLSPDPLDIYQIDSGKGDTWKDPDWRMSHMHSCVWAPAKLGDFFIVNDKGTGHIYSMTVKDDAIKLLFDFDANQLGDADDPGAKKPKPRYVRFHPTKRWFFVNYEGANRFDAFSYDENGTIAAIGSDTVVEKDKRSSLPDGCRFESQDMQINADGTICYSCYRGSNDGFKGTNRIHKSGGWQGVAVYAIDQTSGSVSRIQNAEFEESEGLFWPRGCSISPDGRFLLVATLHGDKIVSIPINDDGTLNLAGKSLTDMDTPSGFTFFEA